MPSIARTFAALAAPAFLATLAPPALADTTALYTTVKSGFTLRIEIDDNGDLRGGIEGQPNYFIKRSGELFLIENTPSGHRVTRFDDLTRVFAEQMKELGPDLFRGRRPTDPAAGLVQKGEATVNGRRGKAYYDRTRDGELYPQPVMVISDDPALAQLGQAMAAQLAMTTAAMATILDTPFAVTESQRILQGGAPLLYAGAKLFTVSSAPIDPSRFTLPGPPETLDQVRVRLQEQRRQLRRN